MDFRKKTFLPLEAFRHIWLQVKFTYHILKINRNTDIYLYFMGESLILPTIVCKFFAKPVIWIMASSVAKIYENDRSITARLFVAEAKINYKLADKIVVYSPKLLEEWEIKNYSSKILIAHEHHIDLDRYKIVKPIHKRSNLVGYVGRLSEEKGVLNFLQAIPIITEKMSNIFFTIGGDGPLLGEIEKRIDGLNLREKVQIKGWVKQEDLSNYFNEMKLIVLPSHTEGLPNVMLEAMACGTPVIATQVGAISDIIQDNKTGFILENNSAECIAENVFRALNHPNLEQIVDNGRFVIEKEFSLDAAREKYRQVLAMSRK